MIPLTRAIPESIRGALRLCAIEINVYFTLLYYRRGTARRAMAVETMSTAAQEYAKFDLKTLESHERKKLK